MLLRIRSTHLGMPRKIQISTTPTNSKVFWPCKKTRSQQRLLKSKKKIACNHANFRASIWKKMPYIDMHFKAFSKYWCLIISQKRVFLFLFPHSGDKLRNNTSVLIETILNEGCGHVKPFFTKWLKRPSNAGHISLQLVAQQILRCKSRLFVSHIRDVKIRRRQRQRKRHLKK